MTGTEHSSDLFGSRMAKRARDTPAARAMLAAEEPKATEATALRDAETRS